MATYSSNTTIKYVSSTRVATTGSGSITIPVNHYAEITIAASGGGSSTYTFDGVDYYKQDYLSSPPANRLMLGSGTYNYNANTLTMRIYYNLFTNTP